jgi:alpha-L-fucosidase 2
MKLYLRRTLQHQINIQHSFSGDISAYYRNLAISTAIAETVFTVAGVKYKREIFFSFPDQVIIIPLIANKPGALNFTVDV